MRKPPRETEAAFLLGAAPDWTGTALLMRSEAGSSPLAPPGRKTTADGLLFCDN